jgi:HEAT repeat protein
MPEVPAMWSLSDETRSLISVLNDRLVPGDRARPDSAAVIAIEAIADRHEPFAILALTSALCDKSDQVAIAAQRAIRDLLGDVGPEDLPEFEGYMRRGEWWAAPWFKLSPDRLADLVRPGASALSVFGVASFHRNGRVRQRAVELLSGFHDGSEVPFLLLRLNDWVPNVREAARVAVIQRLRGGDFKPFARNLFLVLRLDECVRADHSEVLLLFVEKLVGADYESEFLDGVQNADRFVRRRLFKLAIKLENADSGRLVSIGLQSSDPVLRLWAAQRAQDAFDDEALHKFIAITSHDKFAPVRREGLLAVIRRFPQEAVPILKVALFDRSRSIRAFAQFYLAKLESSKISTIYRDALSQGKLDAATSISGLGEAGANEDAVLVLQYAEHESIKVRAVAVRALGRLAGDDYVPFFVKSLVDDSPAVTRAASQSLRGRGHLVDAVTLQAVFRGNYRRQIKMAALHLFEVMQPWTVMPMMVEAVCDPDESIAARAKAFIDGCANRVFTAPTDSQRSELEQSLSKHEARLNPTFVERLLDWLSHRR